MFRTLGPSQAKLLRQSHRLHRMARAASLLVSPARCLLCALLGAGVGSGPAAWAQEPSLGASECKTPGAWGATAPETLMHRYRVQGRASGFTYSAQAQIGWQGLPQQRYRLDYEVKALLLPSRSQTSEGLIQGLALHPVQFTDRGNKTLNTLADPQKQTVRLPLSEQIQALKPGSQDKLSAWVQLGVWVACQTTVGSPERQISMPVWGSGDTETWVWRSNGLVSLNTPYGARQAVHLTRPAGLGGDSRIDLWFVPEWGVLPVRIRVEQNNGDSADQALVERTPRP